MKEHNWSLSWPGNICLDCGQEDLTELCAAYGCCFAQCSCDKGCDACCGTGCIVVDCTNSDHKNGPCLVGGKNELHGDEEGRE